MQGPNAVGSSTIKEPNSAEWIVCMEREVLIGAWEVRILNQKTQPFKLA